MKYIVNTYVTNDKGQFVANPSVYDNAETAIVNYHTTLAAYHNAPDVVTAAVTITDENGVLYDTYREIVNHTVNA